MTFKSSISFYFSWSYFVFCFRSD